MAEHVLKNTAATLTVTFSAGAADGTVTATVLKSDGTTLVSGAAAHGTGGDYTFNLSPQAELDSLTVNWSGTWSGVAQTIQTFVEIIGGLLFTISDLRTFGDKTLNNATTYPDTDLRAARARITDMFNEVCSVSFIPRFSRDQLDGTGIEAIEVVNPRVNRVIAAAVDGVALAGADLTNVIVPSSRDVMSRLLIRKTGVWNWAFGGRNVSIAYEHGYPQTPPDIARAAMVLARYELVSNDISDRMVSMHNDLGEVRLSIPGSRYPTGIPIVDATLSRYTPIPV